MKPDPEDVRANIEAHRRGREIDMEKLVEAILQTYDVFPKGERTFEERPVLSQEQKETIDGMTIDEKEVFVDCLEGMIGIAKRHIKRTMN